MRTSETIAPKASRSPDADSSAGVLRAQAVSRRPFLVGMVVICLGAVFATVLMDHFAFPHGSGNLDEVAYQAQANALADGQLTLPASTHIPNFQPFLSGVHDGRVIFKYQPVWPALIALSDATFGSSLPLRIMLSLAGVLAVMWLAWELSRNRGAVLLAGLVVAGSPFTWVQSASLLGYQLSFVLGAAASAALLYTLRVRTIRAGVFAGALVGLGALHRPFDAALAVVPVLVYCAWQARRSATLGRFAASVLLGSAPFAVLFFAYNQATMGSPLRVPYNVSGQLDTFGFGWRASFQVAGGGHGGQIHYTVGKAFGTLQHFFAVLPRFVALAPAALVCIIVLVRQRPRDSRVWLLVSMILVLIVGYFFWWGSANAFHFRLERPLGPYYGYPLLVPIAVGAAWGAMSLRSSTARIAVLMLGVLWAGATSVFVARDAAIPGSARRAEIEQFNGVDRRLVLELPSFPNDPYVRFANDPDLREKLVVGLDVPGHRLDVVDRFADRTIRLIRVYQPPGDPFGAAVFDQIQLTLLRGHSFGFAVTAQTPRRQKGTTYMRVGDAPPTFSTAGSGTLRATFAIDATTPGMSDRPLTVALGATFAPPGQAALPGISEEWVECRFDARRFGDGIEVLTPCEGYRSYVLPDGRRPVVREDNGKALHVQAVPR